MMMPNGAMWQAPMELPNIKYDYTQYSHDRDVNVIPENDFKHLVSDTFATITDTLRSTYGPYGSSVIITESNQTTTTKDGYNVFTAMKFSHQYKHMVYLTIKDICERVNENVGDGTTSCILLAEKMFNQICSVIHTPEEKRGILKVLSQIEADLQDQSKLERDRNDGIIKPLKESTFMNVIRLAANYDDELTQNLYEAMKPEFVESDDDCRVLSSMRNVVVKDKVDTDNRSNVQYEYEYLSGDYRVGVRLVDISDARRLSGPTDIKVAIFDHAFQDVDWEMLIKGFDGSEKILVIARDFNSGFLSNAYNKYVYMEREMKKKEVKIILAGIDGLFKQNEIQDLAAMVGVTPFTINSREIDRDKLPTVNIQIVDGNCMCLNNCKPPVEYIEKLKAEMVRDEDHYCKKRDYEDRITALSLQQKDTNLRVTAGTALESKIIRDKLQDCTSIIASAAKYGVVPNLLYYAHYRLCDMFQTRKDKLTGDVINAIIESIHGLFIDVWNSKYGGPFVDNNSIVIDDGKGNEKVFEGSPCCKQMTKFYYDGNPHSFDIINNKKCDMEELPTSAQYDIEVVVAAVSIVKYLLTSRAFIFDACLLHPHGDRGIPMMGD